MIKWHKENKHSTEKYCCMCGIKLNEGPKRTEQMSLGKLAMGKNYGYHTQPDICEDCYEYINSH